MNGENQFHTIRKNNDLLEWNTGIHFSIINENKRWNAAYHFYQSEKGLPGSVIFYNDFASQRLFTQNHIINMERIVCKNNYNAKSYGSYQANEMQYTDPSYLNNKGVLIQKYQNNSFLVGQVFNVNLKDSTIDFFGGVEYQLHTLVSQNTTIVYNPKRYIGMFVLGTKIDKKGYLYHLQVNNHQVYTQKQGGMSEFKSIFSGNVFMEKKSATKTIGLPRLQLKRTMRLPTFGELFINTIYEKELKPEIVNQLDLGTSMYVNKFKVGIDIYSNLIENKIVTVPTKNLFLWSVQNVGKVFSHGVDLSIERIFFNESTISIKTKGIYSFQSALDYSSKTSPSYKQQIAYIPRHTGTIDLNLEFHKKVSFNWSTTILSSRYALNENINSNLVSGFDLSDVSIAYTYKTKKQSEFKCNFSVKNLFDTSYQYIRYYVMPGINYLISLSYAFQ
jgi:outer membrane receptor protein involved in Fe transport